LAIYGLMLPYVALCCLVCGVVYMLCMVLVMGLVMFANICIEPGEQWNSINFSILSMTILLLGVF
jgi:hypothetical protein